MYSLFDPFFHINSGNADAWDAVGLLVLLRLWRIVRIANGETNVQIHSYTACTEGIFRTKVILKILRYSTSLQGTCTEKGKLFVNFFVVL